MCSNFSRCEKTTIVGFVKKILTMGDFYSILARWLTDNTKGSEQDYEIYKYGFQSGIEQGAFIVSCIVIALLINSIRAMLLFLIVFYLLRPYIAGFHFKNFLKCYGFSILGAITIVLLSQLLTINITLILIASTSLIIFLAIFFFAGFKESNINEYKYYRKKLVMHLSLIILMIAFSTINGHTGDLAVVFFTLILIASSIIVKKFAEYYKNKCNIR